MVMKFWCVTTILLIQTNISQTFHPTSCVFLSKDVTIPLKLFIRINKSSQQFPNPPKNSPQVIGKLGRPRQPPQDMKPLLGTSPGIPIHIPKN